MRRAEPNEFPETRTSRSAIGLVLAVCVLAAPLAARNQSYTILTEEWAPYNYMEQGRLMGFSVEIVQAILRDLRLDSRIRMLPGMRASRRLNTEPRTMFITMLRTPDREREYKWIGPLGDGAIYFYKKKGNPLSVSSLDEAKEVRMVACRNAGLVRNLLREKGFSNLDTTAPNGESVYRKLLADRCDLGISDAPLGVKRLLREWGLPTDTLVQIPLKIVEAPLYIACSPDIPDAEIAAWQDALDKLKASGVYGSILRRYDQ